ncbi:MAG: hypothetical protein LN413_00560 [Candidatus Thermoplasmatota archaeon]|nr:hypothetical protein [Candidatus Thermoplasmatota archaeon]
MKDAYWRVTKHKPYVYAIAECSCGFQSDHPDLRTAKEAAATHRKRMKEEAEGTDD